LLLNKQQLNNRKLLLTVKMNGAFYVPLLTAQPVFADEQPRRESLKMASRPFQF